MKSLSETFPVKNRAVSGLNFVRQKMSKICCNSPADCLKWKEFTEHHMHKHMHRLGVCQLAF